MARPVITHKNTFLSSSIQFGFVLYTCITRCTKYLHVGKIRFDTCLINTRKDFCLPHGCNSCCVYVLQSWQHKSTTVWAILQSLWTQMKRPSHHSYYHARFSQCLSKDIRPCCASSTCSGYTIGCFLSSSCPWSDLCPGWPQEYHVMELFARWALWFEVHNAVFTTLLWCTGFLRLLVTSQCSLKLLELHLFVFLVTLWNDGWKCFVFRR